MIRFESDYTEGAHPLILERLAQTNFEQTPGYGQDVHCEKARTYIQKLCKSDCGVYFLVGGTQCNTVVIGAALQAYQGVIAADTGHISIHEAGAIEATGHKILTVPHKDGKISAAQIDSICRGHWEDPTQEHMVQPGMVYISFPTEMGTIYAKKELEDIHTVCKKWGLYLYVDGARLGYGLTAAGCDLTLADLAKLCDAFYIGGTKVGALFGEAVVLNNPKLQEGFPYHMKQRGGLLAKGWLLGLQFEALFKDNLYFSIAEHAVQLAMKIRNQLEEKGVSFFYSSETNQQFPIFTARVYEALTKKYAFSFWEKTEDGRIVARICTSWATKEEEVDTLIKDIIHLL